MKHVRGTVFVDAKLPHVPEKFAKGISDYRDGLKVELKGQRVTLLPHGEIIEKLDEFGQTFPVLLLKSDLTLPYTSVFIRLDSGNGERIERGVHIGKCRGFLPFIERFNFVAE